MGATPLELDRLGPRDPRTAIIFGRYVAKGTTVGPDLALCERLVLSEQIVSWVDVETGALDPPVELDEGMWRVLFPGGILAERELVVKAGRRVLFDSIVATP